MTTLNGMLASMQAIAISNLAAAFSHSGMQPEEVPAAAVPPAPNEPPNAPLVADLSAQLAQRAALQSASHSLAGLKPPSGIPPVAEPQGSQTTTLDASTTNGSASFAAIAMAPLIAQSGAPMLRQPDAQTADHSSGALGDDADDAKLASTDNHALTVLDAGFAAAPVTEAGDRTDLFDGTKPATPALAESDATGDGPDATEEPSTYTAAPPRAGDTNRAAAMPTGAVLDPSELSKQLDFASDPTNAAPAALQLERGGVIASFILNAAMIPGWPAQRPYAAAVAADPVRQVPDQAINDEEALTYLANLGASEELLEKIRKLLTTRVPGKKIVVFLASLMTALSVVIGSLRDEFAILSEEQKDLEENRKRTDARGRAGSRERLYLE
jgi:hypothetical protein